MPLLELGVDLLERNVGPESVSLVLRLELGLVAIQHRAADQTEKAVPQELPHVTPLP